MVFEKRRIAFEERVIAFEERRIAFEEWESGFCATGDCFRGKGDWIALVILASIVADE